MKNKANNGTSYPQEWLYLVPKEITIKEIAAVFGEENTEVWEDAKVAEVTLFEKVSIDFEQGDVNRADEVTMAFLQEHQTKTLFLVTIPKEGQDEAVKAMKQAVENLGGIFCGDTPDFTPVISKE